MIHPLMGLDERFNTYKIILHYTLGTILPENSNNISSEATLLSSISRLQDVWTYYYRGEREYESYH